MKSMIKAIIFDCFGVLAEDGWTPFKRKYIEGNAEIAMAVQLLGREVDSGRRSVEDMIRETAKLVGVDESKVRAAVGRQVPNEQLFAYIANELKPKYKIGMLSNAGYDVVTSLFHKSQMQLFDVCILSYEVGLVKPDPRMYKLVAERLGVIVNECVMIDDQQRHCAGAVSVGMQAVYYQDFEQMKRDLSKLLEA